MPDADDRKLYVVAIEADGPPHVDGSPGSLLMILRAALSQLGKIRASVPEAEVETSADVAKGVDRIGTATTVALVHWMVARGLGQIGSDSPVRCEIQKPTLH